MNESTRKRDDLDLYDSEGDDIDLPQAVVDCVDRDADHPPFRYLLFAIAAVAIIFLMVLL